MDSASTWPWRSSSPSARARASRSAAARSCLDALVARQPGAPLEAAGGWPKVPSRLPVKTLRFQAAVVDLDQNPCLAQPGVGQACPQGTNCLQVVDSLAPGLLGVQLRTQPIGFDLAGRAQDVGVVVAVVTGFARGVDRDIDGTSFPVGHVAGEVKRELPALRCRQLGRQRDFELTGDASVLAFLSQLGGVPERSPVGGPRRGTIGQHKSAEATPPRRR